MVRALNTAIFGDVLSCNRSKVMCALFLYRAGVRRESVVGYTSSVYSRSSIGPRWRNPGRVLGFPCVRETKGADMCMGPRVRQRHRNDGGRDDAGLGARIKLTPNPSKRHGEPEKLASAACCLMSVREGGVVCKPRRRRRRRKPEVAPRHTRPLSRSSPSSSLPGLSQQIT